MFQVAQPPSRLPGSVPYILEPKPVPNWFVYHTHHTTPQLPCQCVRDCELFHNELCSKQRQHMIEYITIQPQLQSQVLGAISPQQGQWSLSSNVKPRAQTHKRSATPAYCSLVIHKQYAGECLCVRAQCLLSAKDLHWPAKCVAWLQLGQRLENRYDPWYLLSCAGKEFVSIPKQSARIHTIFLDCRISAFLCHSSCFRPHTPFVYPNPNLISRRAGPILRLVRQISNSTIVATISESWIMFCTVKQLYNELTVR